jgi:hypothetical protein
VIEVAVEAVGPKRGGGVVGGGRVDVYIAEVVVEDVDGVARHRADGRVAVVEATGFQFGEDFREESGLGVDAQHARAETVQQQKTTVWVNLQKRFKNHGSRHDDVNSPIPELFLRLLDQEGLQRITNFVSHVGIRQVQARQNGRLQFLLARFLAVDHVAHQHVQEDDVRRVYEGDILVEIDDEFNYFVVIIFRAKLITAELSDCQKLRRKSHSNHRKSLSKRLPLPFPKKKREPSSSSLNMAIGKHSINAFPTISHTRDQSDITCTPLFV